MKKRNIWRSCCVVLFVLMISAPLLCGLAQKEVPAELTNTETPEAPAFSLRDFLNGSFQSAFDGLHFFQCPHLKSYRCESHSNIFRRKIAINVFFKPFVRNIHIAFLV